MNDKTYRFEAVIGPIPDHHGAFVRFPYSIRKEFGRGRVLATFDGVPCRGSLVHMGVKTRMAPPAPSSGCAGISKSR